MSVVTSPNEASAAAYLDYASTAPLHPAARVALLKALDEAWADPARLYRSARIARIALDGAREQVAAAIEVRQDEVWFTPSGTSAVHVGVAGLLAARGRVGNHLVVSAVEHSCVLAAADAHVAAGGALSVVGVGRTGRVSAADYATVLRADTALACLQSANHEVGTIQPVAEVAASCQALGVPLLVDAAQSLGRIEVPQGWSGLTASAHKFGGPAGVGLLVVRKGTRWRAPGPADERGAGRVPGFENVPAAVAAAAALAATVSEMAAERVRLTSLVERLRTELPRRVPDVEALGEPTERLPSLVTFACLYVDGEALLTELDRRGIAVSSGSSCTSAQRTPSHVLEAMGVLSHGNLRVSLGRESSEADVERLITELPSVIGDIRERAGVRGL